MPRSLMCLLCLLTLAAAIGCEQETLTSDKDLRILERGDVFKRIHLQEAILIDTRTREKYAAGHIPGAISLPLQFMRKDDPRLTGSKVIIVYADGWNDPLSTAGVKRLISLDYKDVFDYKGGVQDWLEAGRTLSSGQINTGRPETGN